MNADQPLRSGQETTPAPGEGLQVTTAQEGQPKRSVNKTEKPEPALGDS